MKNNLTGTFTTMTMHSSITLMPNTSLIRVLKMHSLNNIILVIPAGQPDFCWNADNIRQICDFRTGIGADQVMICHDDDPIKIFNNDGSRAGACGNGTRCIIASMNPEMNNTIILKGPKGVLKGWKTSKNTVAILQGKVHVGKINRNDQWLDCLETQLLLKSSTKTCVSAIPVDIGNAHAIVFGPAPEDLDPHWCAFNKEFPDGVNVSFVWPKIDDYDGNPHICDEGNDCNAQFLSTPNQSETDNLQYNSVLTKSAGTNIDDSKIWSSENKGDQEKDHSESQNLSYCESDLDHLNHHTFSSQLLDWDRLWDPLLGHAAGWSGKSFWVKTWERGIGFSQGCGSAACAIGAVLSNIKNQKQSLKNFQSISLQNNSLIPHTSYFYITETFFEPSSSLEKYDLWMPGGCVQVWPSCEGWIHCAPFESIADCLWHPK